MKPETLTVRNIGPFRGTHTVNFGELGNIFLIYGNTGAGKTTLFDALSYAFYGDAPGSRKGIVREMRSQFAPEGEECAVELVFSLARERYRITRTLPYDKIGVRSGKIQNVAEEVTFHQFADGEWQNRSSTNKNETDKKILDLIGLSEEEFTRIVLLPQGEFSAFLKQNSSQRKDVLAKLFPVQIYGRVTELARTRSREMMLLLADTENAISELDGRFDRNAFAGNRQLLAEQTDVLRNQRENLRKDLGIKTALLEKARTAAEKKEQLRQLSLRGAELEERSDLISRLKEKLIAGKKAEKLIPEYTRIAHEKEKLAEYERDTALVEAELRTKKSALDLLEGNKAHILSLHAEKEKLHLRREQLRIACDLAGNLETEQKKLEASKKNVSSLHKEITALKEVQLECEKRLADLEKPLSSLDSATAESAKARESLEKSRALKILAEEYSRERLSLASHDGAAANTRTALAQLQNDIEIEASNRKILETAFQNGRQGEIAQELASGLTEGEPCPVCGSRDHPSPAVRAEIDRFGLEERLEASKRILEQYALTGRNLDKKLASHEADLKNAQQRLESLLAKYCRESDLDGACITVEDIPTPEAAAELLKKEAQSMQKAADRLGEAQKAYRETEELRRKKSSLDLSLAALLEKSASAKMELEGLKSSFNHKKDRYREAFPASKDGERSDETDPIPDPSEASEALEKCASRALVIEAEIHNHESSLGEMQIQYSALGGKKAELERALSLLKKRCAEDGKRFDELCRLSGFPDGEALRKAECGSDEMARIEEEIASFAENRALVKKRISELESEVALWKGPESGKAEEDVRELDLRITETNRHLEEKTAELSMLDSLKARSDELEKERSSRSLSSASLAAVANDLTGKNPLAVSFDAWVLGMYLEEITSYANERLIRLSGGRYRILLNDNYRRGNRLSGLDLEILDAYTGRKRPSGTLSGGETFMASICLALGLADSIQSRSGGIQLDAVFIDEGFGSLDETSLERAIGILDEIRGSRMVGLISHVAELRSRIPNRIEIVKTATGSFIKKETFHDN